MTKCWAVTGDEMLPLRMIAPASKPVTGPESMRLVAPMVGPPAAKLFVFHVAALAFSHAVG